jgi:hypothetical protein
VITIHHHHHHNRLHGLVAGKLETGTGKNMVKPLEKFCHPVIESSEFHDFFHFISEFHHVISPWKSPSSHLNSPKIHHDFTVEIPWK